MNPFDEHLFNDSGLPIFKSHFVTGKYLNIKTCSKSLVHVSQHKKGPFRVTLPKIVEACGAEPGAPPLTSAKESICQSHKYHYYRIVTARNIELYICRLNLNYTRNPKPNPQELARVNAQLEAG